MTRRLTVLVCAGLWWAQMAAAAEPLHREIDRLIGERLAGRTASPITDDAAFLRRLYLDLAGRIPEGRELRDFLADPATDKRQQVIDRLLAAPSYAQRMRELFHVLLMERRGDDPEWDRFLQTGFEQNRSWEALVRDMLAPVADDEARRGAAFFYAKRLEAYGQNPIDYPGLTRDVGRLFLGVDLQCAQCHDHLFIEDYKQLEFQGLYSVYLNLKARSNIKFPAVEEKPFQQKLEFVSVFLEERRSTGPRVPFGGELVLPEAAEGQTVSTVARLAETLATRENDLFVSNIVNRLWFVMMGRGLVHPLDLHHSKNPPSHPELLSLLAARFAEQNCDIKWLLREIALSETYQRSSLLPDGGAASPPELFATAHEKRLSAEQLFASVLTALGERERLAKPESAEEFKELRSRFVAAFANEPREPEDTYLPTVKGALFLLNDEKLLELFTRRPGNLLDRLAQQHDAAATAEEMYVAVFSRLPSADESREVQEFLAAQAENPQRAAEHLVWAMLSSIEFAVNH